MHSSRLLAIIAALPFAACAASMSAPDVATAVRTQIINRDAHFDRRNNKLVFATSQGELRYWDIRKSGSKTSYHLATLQNVGAPLAMATDATTLALAVYSPPSVVLYNTDTGLQTTIPDADGTPVDVAYDAKGDLVVANAGSSQNSIVVYSAASLLPTTLSCALVRSGDWPYIAADRRGDVFVNQYLGNGTSDVIEIHRGPGGYQPQHCEALALTEAGVPAGLAIDPRNSALAVFSNPDICAGGDEAVLTTYQKPYGTGPSSRKHLGSICAQMLRLGPDAGLLFFLGGPSDAPRRGPGAASTGLDVVNQRTYPSAKRRGAYRDAALYDAITAFPSRVPN